MVSSSGSKRNFRVVRPFLFAVVILSLFGKYITLRRGNIQTYPAKSSWASHATCIVRKAHYKWTPLSASCGPSRKSVPVIRGLKVAIVFYGLPRGLEITTPSIRRNVFAPLESAGITFVTFFHHVIFTGTYSNPRNRERDMFMNATEWKALQPDVASSTKHDEFLSKYSRFIEQVLAFGDPHDNGGLSTRNELEALHALKYATEAAIAAAAKTHPFDGLIILRPDLLYHDPIDVKSLIWAIEHDAVITPAWQLGGGANDRFALGAWQPMVSLGLRFDRIAEYCSETQQPWHPEVFVEWILQRRSVNDGASAQSPCLCHTSQRASRVRAHGRVKLENFCMPRRHFVLCE